MISRALTSTRHFGRDMIVIVLGVLVALGFDSWKDARGEARLESQYIRRLIADLVQDSTAIAIQQSYTRAGEAAALQLQEMLRTGGTAAQIDSIGPYFDAATVASYLSPNSNTIEELKSTGNLRVLKDLSVREAMLGYYSSVSWNQRSTENIMRRGRDVLGELGWDIGVFRQGRAGSISTGDLPRRDVGAEHVRQAADARVIAAAFRSHPDAARGVERAVQYHAMMVPLLTRWQASIQSTLDVLRSAATR
jgi:hypothetical protein